MNVPARLDVVLDDLGVGAALKHLVTDRRAVVIDFHPVSGFPIVVMIQEEWVDREDGECPSKPEHYQVLVLGKKKKRKKKRKKKKQKSVGCSGWRYVSEDMASWLVLHMGHDRSLDHIEDP